MGQQKYLFARHSDVRRNATRKRRKGHERGWDCEAFAGTTRIPDQRSGSALVVSVMTIVVFDVRIMGNTSPMRGF